MDSDKGLGRMMPPPDPEQQEELQDVDKDNVLVLHLMKDSRLTEADTRALANYLTSYIRETPGVEEVKDTAFSVEGRRFSYACTVVTVEGEAGISFYPGRT